MGPQYANRISDLLEDVSNGNQVVATEPEFIVEDVTKPRRDSKICAWVNVIYGCNERCKFCIVPSTRGVEQSRTAESILEEVRGWRGSVTAQLRLARDVAPANISPSQRSARAWSRTATRRSRFSARTSTHTGATCCRSAR